MNILGELMRIEEILERLNKLFDEGKKVLATKYNDSSYGDFAIIFEDEVDERMFIKWKSKCISYFNQILKVDDDRLIDFKDEVQTNRYADAKRGMAILESIIEETKEGNYNFKENLIEKNDNNFNESSIELPNVDSKELKVFISYSIKDYENAKKVYDMFDNVDIECFLAKIDLKGGDNWNPIILQKLKSSNLFILMISHNFHNSAWCNQEASVAFLQYDLNNAFLIPIYLDDLRPYGIFYDVQGISYDDFDSLEEFVKLINVPEDYFKKALQINKDNQQDEIENLIDKLIKSNSYSESNKIFKRLESMELTVSQVNEILEITLLNDQVLNCEESRKFLSKYFHKFNGELESKNVESFKTHWKLN